VSTAAVSRDWCGISRKFLIGKMVEEISSPVALYRWIIAPWGRG
jgi:hypothetical protein